MSTMDGVKVNQAFGQRLMSEKTLSDICPSNTFTNDTLSDLMRSPKMIRAGIFDEWAINTDRHINNILLTESLRDGDLSFIDHEGALKIDRCHYTKVSDHNALLKAYKIIFDSNKRELLIKDAMKNVIPLMKQVDVKNLFTTLHALWEGTIFPDNSLVFL